MFWLIITYYVHYYFHLFSKILLRANYVSGIALGTGNTERSELSILEMT